MAQHEQQEPQDKKAVIFTEGDRLRAVATWTRKEGESKLADDGSSLDPAYTLLSIELEAIGSAAMGELRWESYGFLIQNGSYMHTRGHYSEWLVNVLAARAERWWKENV